MNEDRSVAARAVERDTPCPGVSDTITDELAGVVADGLSLGGDALRTVRKAYLDRLPLRIVVHPKVHGAWSVIGIGAAGHVDHGQLSACIVNDRLSRHRRPR